MARASAAVWISSPSTSIVARLPAAFSAATVRRASSSVEPAMYGAETRFTTDRGTAGRTEATARSKSPKAHRLYRCSQGARTAVAATAGAGASLCSALAHESLAGGADERHRLGEEDPHRVTQRRRLLVGPPVG